jgi:hypothetical protein
MCLKFDHLLGENRVWRNPLFKLCLRQQNYLKYVDFDSPLAPSNWLTAFGKRMAIESRQAQIEEKLRACRSVQALTS